MHLKTIVWTFFVGVMFISSQSFANDPKNEKNKGVKDSSQSRGLEDKGFRSLFEATEGAGGHVAINPAVIPFVKDYLSRHQRHLLDLRIWAKPYFDMMDRILTSHGIPAEMKYLAVIESNLQQGLVSWAGAVGPWQFMPATARIMGLQVSKYRDERRDYVKSTHAAAKYLKILYDDLGDWLLVIAAYNGGPATVKNAIKRSGQTDFWKLQQYLPAESRNHVKKFISTHYILEGHGGETTSTRAEWVNHMEKRDLQQQTLAATISPEMLQATESIEVQGRYNSVILCNALMLDVSLFNLLNPNFDALVNGEKGYSMRLPSDKVEMFKANRFQILYQSVLTTMQGAARQTTGGQPAGNKLP